MNNNKNTIVAFFQSLKPYAVTVFFSVIFSLLAPISVGQGFNPSTSFAILSGLLFLFLISDIFITMRQEKVEKRKREKLQQDIRSIIEDLRSSSREMERLGFRLQLLASEMHNLLLSIENLKLRCQIIRLEFNNIPMEQDGFQIIDDVEFRRVPEGEKKLLGKS